MQKEIKTANDLAKRIHESIYLDTRFKVVVDLSSKGKILVEGNNGKIFDITIKEVVQ